MLSGLLGGLISYAITASMHMISGLEGWRWIFIMEGIPTVFFGVVCFFALPDYPDTCKFLDAEEKKAIQTAIGGAKNTAKSIDRGAIVAILKKPSTYVFCVTLFFMLTSMYCFSFA